MLKHSDLQRSIKGMSFSLARAMHKRSREADLYGLAEREVQYQHEISGTVGTLPVEIEITWNFDVTFMTDSGSQRDSSLDRPQVRHSFEFDYRAPGMIPSAFVSAWLFDDDFNIIGAKVIVGAHSPIAQFEGLSQAAAAFKGALHMSFQGWALLNDLDGNYDGGGSIDLADLPGA